jgi:hypothetical protein
MKTRTLLILVLVAACGGKSQPDAAPPKFVPGAPKPMEIAEAQIKLQAPANLEKLSADKTTVKLGAKGFPGELTLTVKETTSTSGTGTGSECTMDICKYTIMSPCREVECSGTGAFAQLDAVCKSVESTFAPATKPSLSVMSGAMAMNCEQADTDAAHGLDKAIEDLKPGIEACLADAKPADKAEVNVRLETQFEPKPAKLVLLTKLEGFQGDTAKLQACVEALVKPLEAQMPVIKKADCSVGFDHRFQIALEPVCK